jgi:hypothetical protein
MITSTTPGPAASAPLAAADPIRYDAGDLRHPGAQARMRQLLAREGLAIFRGARNRAEVLMAAGTMMTVLPHPDSMARTFAREISPPDRIVVIRVTGQPASPHPGAAPRSAARTAPTCSDSGQT